MPLSARSRSPANLGAVLQASADAAGAIPHRVRAIALRAVYPEAHFNLTRAYASAGQLDAAIRAAVVAREQEADAGKTELGARIQEQLTICRAGLKP